MNKTPQLLTVSLTFALAFAGCAGSTATTPAGLGNGTAAAFVAPAAPPGIDGVAGEFKGAVNDSILGNGKADFQLTQLVGGQAGGSMKLTFGKTAKISSAVALDASNTKKMQGNAVALFGSNPPCTLTISAKFQRKTYMLTGSYKAFNNCAPGQNGTFSAKEQCYYVVAKPMADGVRPRSLPKAC